MTSRYMHTGRIPIGGALMIPVSDVESALRGHAGVDDVALVGCPDGARGELACAVITTSRADPPTLAEPRERRPPYRSTGSGEPADRPLAASMSSTGGATSASS